MQLQQPAEILQSMVQPIIKIYIRGCVQNTKGPVVSVISFHDWTKVTAFYSILCWLPPFTRSTDSAFSLPHNHNQEKDCQATKLS